MAVSTNAAQVVKVTDDHKYKLEEAELERVLMREDIQDLPVAVISVAGVYRAGKSFLLNFFLRYLKATKSQREDGSWLSEDSEPLIGFSWKGGSKRNTTGILLWGDPFVVTTSSGEKVAIILMDTQGTFDSSSTFRDCSTIFALSILLSSVQLYNLFYNINENDLQHLQFFTDYGRIVNEESGKPFQTLEFLVRDWQYPYEHEYGQVGGEDLLGERLEIQQNQPKELRELREHIRQLFEKVSCFLMPHPGFAVMSPRFTGAIKDISPDFRTHLKDLVTSLFSPKKLMVKKINGNVVNAREYVTYFKTYMKIFNSDQIPPADSILKATAEAGLLAAFNEARRVYEVGMEQECGPKMPNVPTSDLEDLHRKYVEKARTRFTSRKKMGTKEEADQYLRKLNEDLEPRLPHYKTINLSKIQKTVEDSKKAYEDSIAAVHGTKPLCVHPIDLEEIHSTAVNAAVRVFDAARVKTSAKIDNERAAFIKSFDGKRRGLVLENERNNKSAATEIRMTYMEYMQKSCLKEPPFSNEQFKKEHEAALNRALEAFNNNRNRPNSYTEDVFKYNMVQAILGSFIDMKKMKESKNKIRLQIAINTYNEFMNVSFHYKQCLHPLDLADDHKTAQCRALQAFQPDRSCTAGFDFSDEDHSMLYENLGRRYEELRSINDTNNREAIEIALQTFKSILEDRLAFSWWWLAIIPAIQTAFSKGKYIKEAREAALYVFRAKRRHGNHYSNDPYLDQLEAEMVV